MGACRYQISHEVFNLIFHNWVQWMIEEIIPYQQATIALLFCLLSRHTESDNLGHFILFSEDFWPLSRHSQRLSKNCLSGPHECFQKFRNISEDCWRLFDHTPSDLPRQFKSQTWCQGEEINVVTNEDMENIPPKSRMWFHVNFNTSGKFSRV